jgi:hypothetical protein
MKRCPGYALVDIDRMRIIAVGGKVLMGECVRCGDCCKPCEHLFTENQNGKMVHVCRNYFSRNMRCALYPQPDDPKQPDCGYWYEEHG